MKNHNNIKLKYTSTYYPQCNGQVERLHRWLKERLSLIAYDGGLTFVDGTDDWSLYINIIQYTYNSTPCAATTYAPSYLIFGRNNYNIPQYDFNPDNPKEYIDYMINRQVIIRNEAAQKQAIYDQLRKKQWDKNRKEMKLEIGHWVLWNINAHFVGNRKKLGPKFVGPYEIVNIFNEEQTFTLRVIPDKLFQNEADRDNPMNKVNIPKYKRFIAPHKHKLDLASNNNSTELFQFNVPRSQIKPYLKRYEYHFDSIQTPIQSIQDNINNNLTETIEKLYESPNIDNNNNNNSNDINANDELESLYQRYLKQDYYLLFRFHHLYNGWQINK